MLLPGLNNIVAMFHAAPHLHILLMIFIAKGSELE